MDEGADRLYLRLPLTRWRERLEGVRQVGWGLELQLDNSALFLDSLREVAALDRALAGHQPRLAHLPNYGVQLGCKDGSIGELSLAVARRGVEAAARLGCQRAVYHTYLLPTIPAHKLDPWLATFLGRFERLVQEAGKLGVRLLVENVWERDGALFDRIFAGWEGQVGMCLDVGHAHCFSRRDFGWWWSRYAPHIEHVHLSDNDGRDDSHRPPPEGTIPYQAIWPTLWARPGLGITFEMPPAQALAAWAHLRQWGG